jgi:hypothetical protein
MAVPPVALLVIRAWLEEGAERPMRIVVRMTADTARGFERELVFSEPEPVGALVDAWLAGMLPAPADRRRRAAREAVTRRSRRGHAPPE